MMEEKDSILENKTEQKEKANDDFILCEKGELKFKGMFQQFIEIQQDRYTLNSMFEKEIDPFKINKIILIFKSKHGKSKRLIIQEKE